MTFIQIIEFKTRDIDGVNKLLDEFLAKTGGKRTAARAMMTKDRDAGDTYLNIVEFPSYDAAMQNSNLPETSEIAAKMAALADGPPSFRNLDVIRVEDMG
jgi:quinol monooxygenase YgiN